MYLVVVLVIVDKDSAARGSAPNIGAPESELPPDTTTGVVKRVIIPKNADIPIHQHSRNIFDPAVAKAIDWSNLDKGTGNSSVDPAVPPLQSLQMVSPRGSGVDVSPTPGAPQAATALAVSAEPTRETAPTEPEVPAEATTNKYTADDVADILAEARTGI